MEEKDLDVDEKSGIVSVYCDGFFYPPSTPVLALVEPTICDLSESLMPWQVLFSWSLVLGLHPVSLM